MVGMEVQDDGPVDDVPVGVRTADVPGRPFAGEPLGAGRGPSTTAPPREQQVLDDFRFFGSGDSREKEPLEARPIDAYQ